MSELKCDLHTILTKIDTQSLLYSLKAMYSLSKANCNKSMKEVDSNVMQDKYDTATLNIKQFVDDVNNMAIIVETISRLKEEIEANG